MPAPQPIRVLVVDDSAFVRKVVREMLATPQVNVVGTARDGAEALDLVAALQPDVVTCDLLMPRMDGLAFIREQMARRPLPILVLTAAAQDGAKAVEALEAGAVNLVRKPTALATDDLRAIRDELVEQVVAAADASLSHPELQDAPAARPHPGAVVPARPARFDVLVLGVSTGGPQALRYLLPRLPAGFPVPIAMVLHMPVGYTALLAEKLNEQCALEVREAKDGDSLQPGVALLAPAGRHLRIVRSASGLTAQLSLQPIDKLHRPSVDVLFQSAAEACGARVLALVMTGMGSDGMEGAAWVKAQGGTVLTEHENSCIIYGMPRSVVEAGLSDAAVSLYALPEALSERL